MSDLTKLKETKDMLATYSMFVVFVTIMESFSIMAYIIWGSKITLFIMACGAIVVGFLFLVWALIYSAIKKMEKGELK